MIRSTAPWTALAILVIAGAMPGVCQQLGASGPAPQPFSGYLGGYAPSTYSAGTPTFTPAGAPAMTGGGWLAAPSPFGAGQMSSPTPGLTTGSWQMPGASQAAFGQMQSAQARGWADLSAAGWSPTTQGAYLPAGATWAASPPTTSWAAPTAGGTTRSNQPGWISSQTPGGLRSAYPTTAAGQLNTPSWAGAPNVAGSQWNTPSWAGAPNVAGSQWNTPSWAGAPQTPAPGYPTAGGSPAAPGLLPSGAWMAASPMIPTGAPAQGGTVAPSTFVNPWLSTTSNLGATPSLWGAPGSQAQQPLTLQPQSWGLTSGAQGLQRTAPSLSQATALGRPAAGMGWRTTAEAPPLTGGELGNPWVPAGSIDLSGTRSWTTSTAAGTGVLSPGLSPGWANPLQPYSTNALPGGAATGGPPLGPGPRITPLGTGWFVPNSP